MAYEFSGSSQYLYLTTPTSLVQGATGLTLSFWLYLDNTNAEYKPLSQWNGNFAQSTFLTAVDSDGKLGLLVTQADENNYSGQRLSSAMSETAWVQCVLTWAATATHAIYLNGASQGLENWLAQGTVNAISSSGSTPELGIGSAADGGELDGRMAEVAVWTRAVTASEALALGKGFSPAFFPQNRVFYAPLVRGIQNLSGPILTNNNATVIEHPRVIYPSGYTIAPHSEAVVATPTQRSNLLLLGVG